MLPHKYKKGGGGEKKGGKKEKSKNEGRPVSCRSDTGIIPEVPSVPPVFLFFDGGAIYALGNNVGLITGTESASKWVRLGSTRFLS